MVIEVIAVFLGGLIGAMGAGRFKVTVEKGPRISTRGRLLYALVGAGINPYNIAGACAFLTGPCLCVYKATAPGTQLLTTADWAAYGAPTYPSKVAEPAPAQPLAAPAVAGATWRNVLLPAAGGLVIALLATVAVWWKAHRATA